MVGGIKAAVRVGFPSFPQRLCAFFVVIHLGSAVGAEHQSSQGIGHACGVCPAHGLPGALGQTPGFRVNNGLVGILKPCVDKKDTGKKQRNKIKKCGKNRGNKGNKGKEKFYFSK